MSELKQREDIEKYIISSLQDESSHQIVEDSGVSEIYFSPGTLRDLFRLSREYYAKHGQPLTPHVFMDKLSRLSFSQQAKSNLHSNLKHIVEIETALKDLPYYCHQLKDHLAGDILKSSFEEALEVSKKGGDEPNIKALEKLQESLVKSQPLLESDCVVRLVDAGEELEMMIKGYQIDRKQHPDKYAGILCGIKEIDDAFASPLGVGELTLFMAPPGGGKSTVMLSVGDAIWRNAIKNVVYASLEMDTLKIGMKHMSNNSAVTFDNMEQANLTDLNKQSLLDTFEARRKLSEKAKFKFLDISTAGLVSTRTLEANIKGLLSSGLEIDVLIVDYLELLYAPEAAKDDHWIRMGYVCKFLRGLGKKYGFSVISAVQLKREAISRIKKTKDGKMDFGADDAQGSNQISADADRIYALWIDPQDERYIKLFTAKNRYGKKSFDCALYFDPACSRVYGDTTSYEHDSIYNEKQYKEIIDLANSIEDETDDKKSNFNDIIYPEEVKFSDIEVYKDGQNDEDEDEDIEL